MSILGCAVAPLGAFLLAPLTAHQLALLTASQVALFDRPLTTANSVTLWLHKKILPNEAVSERA